MLNISSTPFETANQSSILQLAFRPFFLLSAIYAIWLLVRFSLTLTGVWSWESDIAFFPWHAHEFQFGFVMPVVLGFLLTAAQTWTGQESIKGMKLFALLMLWLIARVGMNMNQYGIIISAITDSLVILISISVLSLMVLKGKNYRNFIFVPILCVFLALHLGQVFAIVNSDFRLSQSINYATSWWFAFLISLISARVIPFFVAKAVQQDIPRESVYITLTCQVLILTLGLGKLLESQLTIALEADILQSALTAILSLSLALHLYRLYIWHHRKIWLNPMLWSLWLSYSFLPLSLFLLLLDIDYKNTMHLINLGFIGAIIMAFTARVSLGHTGRKIQAAPVITFAFLAVFVAAINRGIVVIFVPHPYIMYIAAISWASALLCFLYHYTPILIRVRPDNKPG